MWILGHRGASADAPENTLAAFQEALRQRADGVELDVMRCATGEVVVCHDENLKRLAGVDRPLARMAWPELKELDVGTRLGFARARIPLLEEVLATLPAGLQVNVELKCETLDDGGLTQATAELLLRDRAPERFLVSSFNAVCLARLRRIAPQLKRGYLIDPDKSFLLHGLVLPAPVANHSVHPFWDAVTPARASAWHRRGFRLAAWTVDDPQEARRLQGLGVEYCITNRPGELRAALAL